MSQGTLFFYGKTKRNSIWKLLDIKCMSERHKMHETFMYKKKKTDVYMIRHNQFKMENWMHRACITHTTTDIDRFCNSKKLSPQVTTDSDTVFREESIGEGFKIVTVAVFEKILLF